MMSSDQYSIGIDVGGTNTDLVLLINGNLFSAAKVKTTQKVTDGIQKGIERLLTDAQVNLSQVCRIQFGTTHMLNALLQNKVEPVAVIRLAKPGTTSVSPFSNWENDKLAAKANGYQRIVHGGFHYNGQSISRLVEAELIETVQEIKQKNITHIAICGVYSQLNSKQECLAKEIIKTHYPEAKVFLSHIHEGALLERENATIVTAMLHDTLANITKDLKARLKRMGITAELLISENDGSVSPISKTNAASTLRAATRNSIHGAIKLTQTRDAAIVIDIGGTSADGAVIRRGQIVEQNTRVTEAGIPLTVQTVRGHSVALGGGTTVKLVKESFKLGKSVANQLTSQAVSFGGEHITLTDIALSKSRFYIKDANVDLFKKKYSNTQIDEIDNFIHLRLVDFILELMASVSNPIQNLILVGGGAALFDTVKLKQYLGLKSVFLNQIKVPDRANVANAYGAATAKLSATYTCVLDLEKTPRHEAISYAQERATQILIRKGADRQSVTVNSLVLSKIEYLPGDPTQIRIQCVAERDQASLSSSGEVSYYFNDHEISPQEKESMLVKKEENLTRFENPKQGFSRLKNTKRKRRNSKMQRLIENADSLNKQDIEQRAIGYDFLGSGGGGSTRFCKIMVNSVLHTNPKIIELSLNQLPDDAKLFCYAYMGSPAVFEENPPSLDCMLDSMYKLEGELGYEFDAIMIAEGGGLNGLFPYVLSALSNKPVVNGDTIGRAVPGIDMSMPSILKVVDKHVAATSSTNDTQAFTAKTSDLLEETIRGKIAPMGGVLMLSFMAMSAKVAKKSCIHNTSSVAAKIGAGFLSAKQLRTNPIKSINRNLADSGYGDLKEIMDGRVVENISMSSGGFDIGCIIIENSQSGKRFEVIFQNENVLVREQARGGKKKILVQVPDLITVVDADSYQPYGTPDYPNLRGQQVRVLSMRGPGMLYTPEALAVIGPDSPTYKIDRVIQILDKPKLSLGESRDTLFSASQESLVDMLEEDSKDSHDSRDSASLSTEVIHAASLADQS